MSSGKEPDSIGAMTRKIRSGEDFRIETRVTSRENWINMMKTWPKFQPNLDEVY